jgi:hypothetical protein
MEEYKVRGSYLGSNAVAVPEQLIDSTYYISKGSLVQEVMMSTISVKTFLTFLMDRLVRICQSVRSVDCEDGVRNLPVQSES